MDEKGFTLIEVILVIAIIGIISAITVPSFKKYQLKARVVAHNATVNTLKSSATLYFIDNPDEKNCGSQFKSYLEKEEDMQIDDFIASKLKLEKGSEFKITFDKDTIIVDPGIIRLEEGDIILENEMRYSYD